MEYSDFNITVVGLGLIGGSLAMAINKKIKPKNLWGVDIDKESLNLAMASRIIDKGFPDPKEPLQKSDFVFICLYPSAIVEFVKENIESFKPGAIVTDVAGLKESVIREISPVLRNDIDFIGGHPMAGNEFKGIKYASEKIFDGANYIITPSAKNKKANIFVLKDMILKIGFANIIEMTPEEHDDMVAFTSHLPHIIALSLVLNPIIEKKPIYTGSSFQDATRVAKLNSDLWSELLLKNSSNVVKYLETFESNVQEFKKAILNIDEKYLKELFAKACRLKEELELNANSRRKVKG
ncbi:prephenate dehydrogenase [Tepidanaerobacter sp. GT38]|uniref:prephenate dehydrogenase n=1 Tax=Tepidanaerobacter sp. GT38 TaxID=2722793 RepID=UPI001F1C3821|nr:prephenate dehydrogenase [Tepidanaerobacter sp. GT38]MCG1012891.1 prephenate dehydrogenase [Tepidanaerobacter sp. GT38]